MYKKVRIIGGPGSGKTYLGKKLAQRWNVPLLGTDDTLFAKDDTNYTKFRTKEERKRMMDAFCKKSSWVVEGVSLTEKSRSSIEKADVVVFLDVSQTKQLLRILRRSIQRRFRKEEKKETFARFIRLIAWSREYPQYFKENRPERELLRFTSADKAFEYLTKEK